MGGMIHLIASPLVWGWYLSDPSKLGNFGGLKYNPILQMV